MSFIILILAFICGILFGELSAIHLQQLKKESGFYYGCIALAILFIVAVIIAWLTRFATPKL